MSDIEHIKLWLHGRPDTTTREYRREIEKLASTLVSRSLLEAKLVDLQQHVATLKHLAPRSRGRAVAAIRSFYKFLVRAEIIARSPAEALMMPKVSSELAERILTAEEVENIIRAAPDYRTAVMLCVLYAGGLRASELCGRCWSHILPDNRLSVTGKGNKTRKITLPLEVVTDLLLTKPEGAKPTDPIFPGPSGNTMGTRQLLRIVKGTAVAAGLSDKVSCHWLRHSCASHALDNGAPLHLVRDHLGHSSIATTDRYLHSRQGDSASNYLGGMR